MVTGLGMAEVPRTIVATKEWRLHRTYVYSRTKRYVKVIKVMILIY